MKKIKELFLKMNHMKFSSTISSSVTKWQWLPHLHRGTGHAQSRKKPTRQSFKSKLIFKINLKIIDKKRWQEAVYKPTGRRHSCSSLYLMQAHCFKLIFIPLHTFLFFINRKITHTPKKKPQGEKKKRKNKCLPSYRPQTGHKHNNWEL